MGSDRRNAHWSSLLIGLEGLGLGIVHEFVEVGPGTLRFCEIQRLGSLVHRQRRLLRLLGKDGFIGIDKREAELAARGLAGTTKTSLPLLLSIYTDEFFVSYKNLEDF